MTDLVREVNHVSAAWLDWILRSCWQAALAIALVWLICRTLPRTPPFIQLWLWRLVYLKLLVVLLCTEPIELPLLPAVRTAPGVSAGLEGPVPPMAKPSAFEVDNIRPHAPGSSVAAPAATLRPSAATLALCAWLLGVGLLSSRLLCHWHEGRLIRLYGQPVSDRQWVRLLAMFCARMRLRRPPALLAFPIGGSPLLVGTMRPAIVVPQSMVDLLDATEMRTILAHELAHLKRRDLLWNWLPTLVHVLLFFHPLALLARRQWHLAQEVACDELAVRLSASSVGDYGRSLLAVVEACRAGPGRPRLAAGVSDSFTHLHWRLNAMKRFHPLSPRGRIAAIAVVAMAALIGVVPWTLTGASQPAGSAQIDLAPADDAVDDGQDTPAPSPDELDTQRDEAAGQLREMGGFVRELGGEEPRTVQITLEGAEFNDTAMPHVAKLVSGRRVHLRLEDTAITESGLAKLKEARFIDSLDLSGDLVINETLKALPELPLAGLVLERTQLSNEGMAVLEMCRGLKRLTLASPRFSDDSLARLKSLPELESLSLVGPVFTDDGIEHVGRLTRLREFSLRDTLITHAGLAQLATLRKLEKLAIHHSFSRRPRENLADDRTLRLLNGSPALRQLYFFGDLDVTDEGLRNLSAMSQLEVLTIQGDSFGDEGLEHLKGLSNLKWLSVRESKVSGAGLQYLRGMDKLWFLDLSQTELTDEGMAAIGELKGLRHLNLSVTKVSDAGLEDLNNIGGIAYLDLIATNVTVAAVEKLKTAFPALQVKGPRIPGAAH